MAAAADKPVNIADAKKVFSQIEKGEANLKKDTKTDVHDGLAQAKLLGSIQRRPSLNAVGQPKERGIDQAKAEFLQAKKLKPAAGADEKKVAFVQGLDAESLEYFSQVCKRTFSEQASFFLNAFWDELGDQAEFIYSVAWEVIKLADRRWRNVQYIHLYEEGNDLDFDMALYFFEQLVKYLQEPSNKDWVDKYPKSQPVDKTAVVRKKEIRESVDVNFDGRISFLEYLLYQYNVSPKDLMDRSSGKEVKNEALEKAKAALAEVNRQIRAYETEKKRLEDLANSGNGVKALGAKNLLAQLTSSPQAEKLRAALIKAEAAVRIVSKQVGVPVKAGEKAQRTEGDVWWMEREIATKKKLYGAPGK